MAGRCYDARVQMAARRGWWIAGVAVAAAVIVVGILLFARRDAGRFEVRPVGGVLPADGRERVVMQVVRLDGGVVPAGELAVEAVAARGADDGGGARVAQAGSAAEIWMRAPVMAAGAEGAGAVGEAFGDGDGAVC